MDERVIVVVQEARNLEICCPDKTVAPNPYVVVACGHRTTQTHAVKKNVNPMWSQNLHLQVPPQVNSLTVMVRSQGSVEVQEDLPLGFVQIPLALLQDSFGESQTMWFRLQPGSPAELPPIQAPVEDSYISLEKQKMSGGERASFLSERVVPADLVDVFDDAALLKLDIAYLSGDALQRHDVKCVGTEIYVDAKERSFTAYKLHVRRKDGKQWMIWTRYSELFALRKMLCETSMEVPFVPFPRKTPLQWLAFLGGSKFGNMSRHIVTKRAFGFEEFFRRISSMPVVYRTPALSLFFKGCGTTNQFIGEQYRESTDM
eukprot:GILK01005322.1.p1 GENE.GILK01005322.1~~GILK01005322.1.p1  ORF type:complete len:327 (+),score=34.19 GILK01005322.1:35-982(+)